MTHISEVGHYLLTMSRRLIVNRLEKEELEWELKYRGVQVGPSEEMRSRLASALRLEKSNESFRYPKYPFSYAEDKAAIEKKCLEIQTLLNSYGGSSLNEHQKLQTKLHHALNRLDQMETGEEAEKVQVKSELLSKILQLYDEFHNKSSTGSTGQVPAALGVLAGGLPSHSQTGIENAPSSSPFENRPSSLEVSHRSEGKMVPPHKWGLEKFSGTAKSLSVTAFFERVEELRIARSVAADVLLDSGVDLFVDKAYQFYKDARLRVQSWDELKEEFKREYLSAHHTDLLFDELRKRTQHSSESIGVYLAVMSSYFSRLGCHVPEEAKMAILVKNLHPFYQDRLRDPLPATIEELRQVCRRMEDRRDAINSYVEPNCRKGSVLERDLAFVEVDFVENAERPEIATTSVDQGKSVVCFRCKLPGHRAIGCALPKSLYCFKCKKEGFTTKTCPACNQGNDIKRS